MVHLPSHFNSANSGTDFWLAVCAWVDGDAPDDVLIGATLARLLVNACPLRQARSTGKISPQHLWTEVYEGAIADVLEVQSKVARDVAAGIRAQLSRDEKSRLTVSRKVSPEAYSLTPRF